MGSAQWLNHLTPPAIDISQLVEGIFLNLSKRPEDEIQTLFARQRRCSTGAWCRASIRVALLRT
jgi:hypothetical protein